VTEEEKQRYHREGFIAFDGVVSEEELQELEQVVDRFIRGEISVPGKDFCDMSKGLDAKPEDFNLVNAMLPRKYYPPWQGNIFERRCNSISRQLYGDGMVYDFDQILAKKPTKQEAVFAWHQDLAYWPKTRDMRTATISLALDDATPENGCIKFVVGSHKEKELRRHYPMKVKKTPEQEAELAKKAKAGDKIRDDVHTLVTDVDEVRDPVKFAPVKRGGASVHEERIVHGSGGNKSKGWRRTYICVHRAYDTVKWEREHGFTHSHNDTFNWDQFNKWQDRS